MRLDHVGLCCKPGELEQAVEYYKKLGFVVYKTTEHKGYQEYFMGHEKDRSCQVDIHQNVGDVFTPIHHFCLLVDDAQRVYDELKAKGVEVGDPPVVKPNGRKIFMIRGPYGVGIQYCEEMPFKSYAADFAKQITER